MARGSLCVGAAVAAAACGIVAPLDGLSGGAAGVPEAGDTGVDAVGGDAPSDAARDVASDVVSDVVPAASCEAGLTACGAACVELGSNGASCGRCGHDCGGGICTGGVCQPYTLASGVDAPRALTVVGSTVYFTTHATSGSVSACSTGGCGSSPTILTSGVQQGAGIAVSGSTIFFAAYGNSGDAGATLGNGVFACSIGGCVAGTPLASSPGNPVGVTTDGTLVYWNDSTLGQILSCAVGGCGGAPTVVTGGLSSPWYGVSVDATRAHVYWTDRGAGTVGSCDLPACAKGVQTLAANLSGPYDLALDATSVYFTSYDPSDPRNAASGSVQGCAVAGCSSGHTTFAAQAVTPSGIAVDGAGIYWANNGDGTVAYCPTSGCPSGGPTLLANQQGGPFLVALDTAFVYWTNTSGGEVMKVAKP
jgi:hypothetical protein